MSSTPVLLDGGVGEVQGGVRGRVDRGVPGGVVPGWRRMGSGCGSEMALRGSGCVTWEVGALSGAAVAVGEVGRRDNSCFFLRGMELRVVTHIS